MKGDNVEYVGDAPFQVNPIHVGYREAVLFTGQPLPSVEGCPSCHDKRFRQNGSEWYFWIEFLKNSIVYMITSRSVFYIINRGNL